LPKIAFYLVKNPIFRLGALRAPHIKVFTVVYQAKKN